MGRAKQTLKVIPNPYGVVDLNGQPCCAVKMASPEHVPYGTHRYVGASIVHAEVVRPAVETKIGNIVHQTATADHDITWEFSTEAVEVPDIGYYREHISRGGDLVAADKATARLCGISESTFIDPKKFLAAAKEAARKAWDDQHGEGDFVKAEQERAEAKAARTKSVEPVAVADGAVIGTVNSKGSK
jgi:hypothetical protein